MRSDESLKCPECGEWLENTAAGNYSTCPRMHGKLKPKLTWEERDHCDLCRAVAVLPKAKRVKRGVFTVKGKEYRSCGRVAKRKVIDLVKSRYNFTAADGDGYLYAHCKSEKRPFLLLKIKVAAQEPAEA